MTVRSLPSFPHIPHARTPSCCARVTRSQSVDKIRFYAGLAHPAADLLAAAVYDNRLESDQLEKDGIFDNVLHQIIVEHRAPAVLDDDDLAVEPLYIWQRLDEDACLFHVFLIYHFLIVPFRMSSTLAPRL